jgi:hypothetical protein
MGDFATGSNPRMNADGPGPDRHRSVIDALTERLIEWAFSVSNLSGAGLLEKVHETALAPELRQAGLCVAQPCSCKVFHDGQVAQTIRDPRATGHHIGLILDFPKPNLEIKRVVHRL